MEISKNPFFIIIATIKQRMQKIRAKILVCIQLYCFQPTFYFILFIFFAVNFIFESEIVTTKNVPRFIVVLHYDGDAM